MVSGIHFLDPLVRNDEPESIPRNPNIAQVFKGKPSLKGASVFRLGVNFAVLAKTDNLALCIFDPQNRQLIAEFRLDANVHKTKDIWHVFIKSLPPFYLYAYQTAQGTQAILDPYAKSVVSRKKFGVSESENKYAYDPLGVILPPCNFDWQGINKPSIPKEDLIIYEMHVRGFTQHPTSNVTNPGTFSAIISKIPYLKNLGINAVELLPVQEFDELNFDQYWGYNTINFFALMQRYSAASDGAGIVNEFKTMVRELHRNHIEVILDIAFNHTGEGDHRGPSLSFKALSANDYYIRDEVYFKNYTDCGNTFNCNSPAGLQFVMDVFKYWVEEMGIDGFRIDLASTLFRNEKGDIDGSHPLLDLINNDEVLSQVKLIAEPWEPQAYALGRFSRTNSQWQEWNDKFRDATRKYIRGDASAKGEFADSLCGSSRFLHSIGINFITCHDGHSLKDLVSHSMNCNKQMKNHYTALMASTGTPMLRMGDEYGHTLGGNDNPYNLDEINWFLWEETKDNEMVRFVSLLNKFRSNNSVLRKNHFLTHEDVTWHGHESGRPNWDGNDPLLVTTFENTITVAFNPSNEYRKVMLPEPNQGLKWHVIVNTSAAAPNDITEEDEASPLSSPEFVMHPFTAIILKSI